MLDADEIATFDEAMREDPALRKVSTEMDRLAAAIAASAATPIQPPAGLLDEIQRRVKPNPARSAGRWLTISGWAAALGVALMWYLGRNESANQPTASAPPRPSQPAAASTTTAETRRLTQEIEVLRDNLEKYQHRDRALFTATPGMALPIVMTMTPPGMVAGDFQITTLLGDALRAATVIHEDPPLEDASPPADLEETPTAPPSAMPIYDSARDSGTLVTSNLPPASEAEVYNLWVTTQTATEPIYVGSLPQSSASGADSFDFSLGSTMVLPTGFMLTKDPVNHPAPPTPANTVLQGPSAPLK